MYIHVGILMWGWWLSPVIFIKFGIWVSSLGCVCFFLGFFLSNADNLKINRQKKETCIWVTLKWQWRTWFKMKVHSEQLNLSLKWRIMGTVVRTGFHPIFSFRQNTYCRAQRKLLGFWLFVCFESVFKLIFLCLFWLGHSKSYLLWKLQLHKRSHWKL